MGLSSVARQRGYGDAQDWLLASITGESEEGFGVWFCDQEQVVFFGETSDALDGSKVAGFALNFVGEFLGNVHGKKDSTITSCAGVRRVAARSGSGQVPACKRVFLTCGAPTAVSEVMVENVTAHPLRDAPLIAGLSAHWYSVNCGQGLTEG